MLEMRYRLLGLTREPFMCHWTWSGGGLGNITCTIRVGSSPFFTTTIDCMIGTGTTPEKGNNSLNTELYDISYNSKCFMFKC